MVETNKPKKGEPGEAENGSDWGEEVRQGGRPVCNRRGKEERGRKLLGEWSREEVPRGDPSRIPWAAEFRG